MAGRAPARGPRAPRAQGAVQKARRRRHRRRAPPDGGRLAAILGLVDTHIHLDEIEDWRTAVEEAVAAGVTTLIAMGVDADSTQRAIEMAESHPAVWAAAGHHPMNRHPPDLQRLGELARHPRVVAIGEVGLDRSEDEHVGPWPQQREWFEALCLLAVEQERPVCVHIRETAGEVHEILGRLAPRGLRAVIHYWSLDAEWARRFIDLGCHLSFAGTITRRSKEQIREVARMVPEDRLLLETDAPWGTPQGHSGPMRPAWMVRTAETLAEVRGLSLERLAEIERANVARLFPKIRL
ncbi:MAG TPA: TatD family hydrolase [Candidatus Dormibacteraeota bacterium]